MTSTKPALYGALGFLAVEAVGAAAFLAGRRRFRVNGGEPLESPKPSKKRKKKSR